MGTGCMKVIKMSDAHHKNKSRIFLQEGKRNWKDGQESGRYERQLQPLAGSVRHNQEQDTYGRNGLENSTKVNLTYIPHIISPSCAQGPLALFQRQGARSRLELLVLWWDRGVSLSPTIYIFDNNK